METCGLNVTVPDSLAGRERAGEGIEVLVKAAVPHYSRAVRSIQSGEVQERVRSLLKDMKRTLVTEDIERIEALEEEITDVLFELS